MEGNGDVVCKSRLTLKRWLCEQGQIYREPDEAESSGLLTWTHSCTAPFQGPGRSPNNALKCSEILQLIMWKKIDRGFAIFDSNSKSLRDIANNELYSWKKLF